MISKSHRSATQWLWVCIIIGPVVLGAPARAVAACEFSAALLNATDGSSAQLAGSTVAVSGSVALSGAIGDFEAGRSAGAVYAFRKTSHGWGQDQRLYPSQLGEWDQFGYGLAVEGDVAVASAFLQDGTGVVYVFRHAGDEWIEEGRLTPSDGAPSDYFGMSVDIAGDVILIGAPNVDDRGANTGAAYVFRHDGRTWNEEAKLYAPDAVEGDRFGGAVALDGNLAVMGAVQNDDLGDGSGSIYVFRFDGSRWAYEALLLAEDGAAGDYLGGTLDVSGDIIVAGLDQYSSSVGKTGAALVYAFDGAHWSQTATLFASDGLTGDRFGASVSVSAQTIVVGAPGRDSNEATDSGAVYAFDFDGVAWREVEVLLAPLGWWNDALGTSVAVDGATIVAGAPNDDDAGNNSGSITVFEGTCADGGCQSDTECDDGLYCNGRETCLAGTCKEGTRPCIDSSCDESLQACVECLGAVDCDDDNECTDDTCDTGGVCTYFENNASCTVGSGCASEGVCDAGQCLCPDPPSKFDVGDFIDCMRGPDRYAFPQCQGFDANADGLIDLTDYGLLETQ